MPVSDNSPTVLRVDLSPTYIKASDENTLSVRLAPTYLKTEGATVIKTNPQGPPGPQGLPGPIGDTATAGENISVYQVLTLINGLLYIADPTDPTHGPSVVGVAIQSGTTGSPINYCIAGTIGSGSFTQGVNFAGLSGALTLTPSAPGARWVKQIGIAKSISQFVVEMGPTIFV